MRARYVCDRPMELKTSKRVSTHQRIVEVGSCSRKTEPLIQVRKMKRALNIISVRTLTQVQEVIQVLHLITPWQVNCDLQQIIIP